MSILAGVTVAALELNEDLVIDDSSSEEELMPMAAVGCSSCTHTYTQTSYSGGVCPTCDKSVSGTVIRCSKCGYGWVKLTCGHSFKLSGE